MGNELTRIADSLGQIEYLLGMIIVVLFCILFFKDCGGK